MKTFLAAVVGLAIGYCASVASQVVVNSPAEPVSPLWADIQGILMVGQKPNGRPSVILVDAAGRVICSPSKP